MCNKATQGEQRSGKGFLSTSEVLRNKLSYLETFISPTRPHLFLFKNDRYDY